MFDRRDIDRQQILQPAFTGRIILRLEDSLGRQLRQSVREHSGFVPFTSLSAVAGQLELGELSRFLEATGLDAQPLLPPEDHGVVVELEDRAHSLGILAPLRSLLAYFAVAPEPGWRAAETQSLVRRLRATPGVAWAVREPLLREPASTPFVGAVSDDQYFVEQGYLDGGGVGINTRNAKVWEFYDGAGVRFGDIEVGWQLDHVDLLRTDAGATIPLNYGINVMDVDPGTLSSNNHRYQRTGGIDHGTMTLGVVVGRDHPSVQQTPGPGIVGIAPAADARLYSRALSWGEQWDLTGAIKAAVADLDFGSVLLIEVETVDPSLAITDPVNSFYPATALPGLPVETVDHWFDAIRLAVGNGITVVEPAGNAGKNLDDIRSDWSGPYESGAIMVSACDSTLSGGAHEIYSPGGPPDVNHGVRVDCYAWGEDVFTSSYLEGVTDFYWYYDYTSAASAVIAGAAILVQQMFRNTNGGDSLDPLLMRALLSDPANGTAVTNTGGYARAMPDLAKIADVLGAWPDVYVRDRVDDTGYVPNQLVYSSPDIIVRQNQVNIAAELGPASPTAMSMPAIDPVVPDQDNFVYVRMLNRGLVDAAPAVVHVYWSEASALVPPSEWHPVGVIGAGQGLVVPANNLLTVAGPIVWHPPQNGVPSTGHGCFIALIGVPGRDPVPPILPSGLASSWDDFLAYVGANNNVAWRNFNVLDLAGGGGSFSGMAAFMIRGVRDRPLPFDLAIDVEADSQTVLRWTMPPPLYQELVRGRWCIAPGPGRLTLDTEPGDEQVALTMRGTTHVRFEGIRLTGLSHPCSLHVTLPHGDDASAQVVVRQFYGGREVGRLTRRWRIPAR